MPHVRRLALCAAGALLLAGCAQAEAEQPPAETLAPLPDLPDATPTADASPAGAAEPAGDEVANQDEDAGVATGDQRAVEEALVRYLAGIEELRADNDEPYASLYGLTRGELTEEWLIILGDERQQGLELAGNASVVSQTVTEGADGTWDITACLDISTYQLYFPDGQPQPRDPSYPQRNINYFTVERHEGALYFIADTPTRETC